MAKSTNVFKIRGRVGNVVFCERDGKVYVRTLPLKVKDPQTEKQMAVRNRFRTAVAFYQQLRQSPVGEMWSRTASLEQTSSSALFMRKNLKMFNPNGEIDNFDGLLLATGSRMTVNDLSASVDANDRVTLTWRGGQANHYLDNEDRLHVVVLYSDRTFSPQLVEGVEARRGEGSATFRLERGKDESVHVYCFFEDPVKGTFSDSQHVFLPA